MKSMFKSALIAATLLFATSAFAADNKLSVGAERTDYSGIFGERNTYSIENVTAFGPSDKRNHLVLGYTYGERQYDGATFDTGRWNGALSIRWGKLLSTQTSVAFAGNTPVFAERDYGQDVTVHLDQFTVSGGVRRTEYFNDATVDSWNVRGALYFGDEGKRGSVSYRYAKYDLENVGTTDSHLVSLRVNDFGNSLGNTQLWVGKGSTLQDDSFGVATASGDLTSYTLRRVQPISSHLAVNLTVGYREYERALGNYDGTTYGVGLTANW